MQTECVSTGLLLPAVAFRINKMFFVSIGVLPNFVKLTPLVRNVLVMVWACVHLWGINVSLCNLQKENYPHIESVVSYPSLSCCAAVFGKILIFFTKCYYQYNNEYITPYL